jgi:hypothetical protein
VPTGASVDHVEDDVLVDKYQITLDLCIERVCHFHVTRVRRPGFSQFPAKTARLGDLRQHVQYVIGNSAALEHLAHRVV